MSHSTATVTFLDPTGNVWASKINAMLGPLVEVPSALLVVAEIVILFAGVVGRYIFHAPLVWSDELASILFLWLAMLGLLRRAPIELNAWVSLRPSRSAFGNGPTWRESYQT